MNDGVSYSDSEKAARRQQRIGRVAESGLVSAVSRAGGQLLGLSVKYANGEVLVTLRAVMPAGRMVCFVGAEDLGGCLLKASRDANNDKLRWRTDKYAR